MDLKTRLRRLERAPGSATIGSPDPGELTRRLDRLLGTGAVKRATDLAPATHPSHPPRLEQLLQGRRIRTASGHPFLCEARFSKQERHGRMPVGDLRSLHVSGSARLFSRHLAGIARPEAIAFVDTETTGLAGGAGTVAFLIGVARWTGDEFRIAQLFLEDLDREPALLEALAEELRGVECLVTYNGKTYDLPLLRSRHVLNRRPWPVPDARHLDLLHPARALWGQLYPDCRLVTLEERVLGHVRRSDVPGADIPGIYLRYLRQGPDHALAAVLEHNRLDLLSLAGLLWSAGEEGDRPEGAPGLGVGALHARNGRGQEARAALENALQAQLPRHLRTRGLRNLSLDYKASGEWQKALMLWEELASLGPAGDPFPFEEAAKTLEHRLKDPEKALFWVEQALSSPLWSAQDRAALEKRRRRLEAKVAGPSTAAEQGPE